ncbi:hypothetical protein BT69DRAFT_1283106 [Atractiella rhizophila]|nr:hypothetical protein BT69DRAFT_1283106 [Atractiella rhizophila]
MEGLPMSFGGRLPTYNDNSMSTEHQGGSSNTFRGRGGRGGGGGRGRGRGGRGRKEGRGGGGGGERPFKKMRMEERETVEDPEGGRSYFNLGMLEDPWKAWNLSNDLTSAATSASPSAIQASKLSNLSNGQRTNDSGEASTIATVPEGGRSYFNPDMLKDPWKAWKLPDGVISDTTSTAPHIGETAQARVPSNLNNGQYNGDDRQEEVDEGVLLIEKVA